MNAPLNILIVDDSKTVRAVICKTLAIAGIGTKALYEAENGSVGLQILHEHAVDLVFTDINMPVMNGIEMVEQMRSDRLLDGVPVIVVSTEGSTTRIEELKRKGVCAYIRKPFCPETVRNAVEDVLEMPTLAEQMRCLADALLSVLEQVCFMFGERLEERSQAHDSVHEAVQTTMQFSGHRKGTVSLTVPTEMCMELAANVMGVDPDEVHGLENAEDALKEVLNVTCGSLLTAMFGFEPVFDLSIPEVSEIGAHEWRNLGNFMGMVPLTVDEYPVYAVLHLE